MGERKEIWKKNEKDSFWLTQENKQNLIGKKSYFFPRGKEYHIFSIVNAFKIWSKMLYVWGKI